MKKLIYSLFLSLPITVMAQNKSEEIPEIIKPISITVPCGPSTILIDELRKTHNNFPVLLGNAGSEKSNTTMTFWIDTKKDKWVVLMTKDDVSCVFAYGSGLNYIPPKPVKDL